MPQNYGFWVTFGLARASSQEIKVEDRKLVTCDLENSPWYGVK